MILAEVTCDVDNERGEVEMRMVLKGVEKPTIAGRYLIMLAEDLSESVARLINEDEKSAAVDKPLKKRLPS